MKTFFALFAAIVGNHVASVDASVGGERKLFFPISMDDEPEYCDLQECFDENGFFHQFIDSGTAVTTFEQMLALTPEGCVMAPVNRRKDVLAAMAALPSNNLIAYVGVYKTLEDYSPGNQRFTEWNNVDGTPVPVVTNIWDTGEPDAGGSTSAPAELYAVVSSSNFQLMRDTTGASDNFRGAVYKCCYVEQALCSAPE